MDMDTDTFMKKSERIIVFRSADVFHSRLFKEHLHDKFRTQLFIEQISQQKSLDVEIPISNISNADKKFK